ncbi:hypothetical protein QJS66_16150 [Kocuria rhizophila]|nr:hypothetical protein QJS66_16150 [Kocuria rhizophila]
MGQGTAGLRRGADRPRTLTRRARPRVGCCLRLSPADRASPRLPRGPAEEPQTFRDGSTTRRRSCRGSPPVSPYGGPRGRRVQGLRLPALPVRAGVRGNPAPRSGGGGRGSLADSIRLAVPKAYVVLADGRDPPRDRPSILRRCRVNLAVQAHPGGWSSRELPSPGGPGGAARPGGAAAARTRWGTPGGGR